MHEEIATDLPEHARPLIEDFKGGVASALGQDLAGIYLYGAMTFAESASTARDVDYHVLLHRPVTDAQGQGLIQLHQRLEKQHPLGDELDGYYLLLSDTRSVSPPADQLRLGIRDDAWALHRAHILSGHVVTLAGPDPSTIYQPASWEELDAALQGELSHVRERVEQYPAYCTLNLCRLMYSYRHRDVVVSKREGGRWALRVLPKEWHGIIKAALQAYAEQAEVTDQRVPKQQLGDFLRFAEADIAAAR